MKYIQKIKNLNELSTLNKLIIAEYRLILEKNIN